MSNNENLIKTFYTAFNNRDYLTMQNCYHADAIFFDPVFRNLKSKEVKAMWQMLVSASKDIKIILSEVKADDTSGSCRWDAFYTFSQTNRKVHNIIYANFKFKDGLIIDHHDHFDFWRWSRMALGIPGWLLGWSSYLENKISNSARGKLNKVLSPVASHR